MTRFKNALACVSCLGFVVTLHAAPGMHDPAFDRIPFTAWMSGPDSSAKIHWSAQVAPAQLSFHQRLFTAVTAKVDGADLARRRGKGEFVLLAQFTDAAGAAYQSHIAVDLKKVEEGLGASNVSYSVRAFVRPGEYQIAILLVDSASKEHWSKNEKVTFSPLRHDAFPGSWNDLEPVEFIPSADPPEIWLVPESASRLNIPAKSKTPARIDVLVNLTPTEQHAGSERFRDETLAALIPTLQVLSEMRLSGSTMNVALLELSRRRVVFHQETVHNLQWESLKDAFAGDATGTIDVKSLQDRGRNAAFFVKEVSRRVSADLPAGTKHALIVLSGATAFEPGEDLRPVEATRPADCPVFYIRYHVPIARPEPQYEERRRVRGVGFPRGTDSRVEPLLPELLDQLEKTLKPLAPRVFDVQTPDEMRKAIAEIRDAVESL